MLVHFPDAAAAGFRVVLFTKLYFVILPQPPPSLTSSTPVLEDSNTAL